MLATLCIQLAFKLFFQALTCGHRLSIWVAAIRTNFTPSSLLEMEQAKLATWTKASKKKRETWLH